MESYLKSVIKQFDYYKQLGDKTIHQLSFEDLKRQYSESSNTIAVIVKHLSGNMLSRWTNFLTEDGEKQWRMRDDEFLDSYTTKEELLQAWHNGWHCLFGAIDSLSTADLEKIIYIRNQGHTVTEAINRQLMHYAYHIGQIVFLGKLIQGSEWQSLSIPKEKSADYNANKFSKHKARRHFTEDL